MNFKSKKERNGALADSIDRQLASGIQKSVAVRKAMEDFGIFTEATVYRIYKQEKGGNYGQSK